MRDMNRLFNLFLERLEDRVLFFNLVLLGLKRNPGPIIRAQAKAAEAAAEEAAISLLGDLDLEEMECITSPAASSSNQKKKRAMAAAAAAESKLNQKWGGDGGNEQKIRNKEGKKKRRGKKNRSK